MKRLILFFKSIRYSFELLYYSSKFEVIVYLGLNLLCTTIPLMSAFVFKLLIDALSNTFPNTKYALMCAVGIIGLLVLSQALNSIKSITYNSIYNKAIHFYNCKMLNKVSQLPMSIIDTSSGRDTIDDVRYINDTAVSLIFRIIEAFSCCYTFTVAFIALIRFNIWFSLLFIVLTIPGVVLDWILGRKLIEFRHNKAPDVRKFSYYRWMLTDAGPAKDVRMYDLTDAIKERYNSVKDEYLRANIQIDKKELYSCISAELIKRSGEIAFIIFTVLTALQGQITLGDVSLYIGFALTIASSFEKIASIIVVEYADNTELFKIIFDFWNINITEQNQSFRELSRFESLTFDNVYFKYPGTEKYVLSGASFTLNRGDKLSIIGINGSGKSTIVKLMLGLYEIDCGKILINGYPMSEYDMKDVRKLFSVLFQNFVQYPLTLRENITLSNLDRLACDDEIESVLKQSGIYDDLKTNLHNGFDSFMTRQFDDHGIELSRGQWQKIALSRAYFKNSEIVVFDEPSAALDAEAEDRIFNDFESISNDKTGIMISHRISSARMSNKIIVLSDGKITEQGTHDELLSLGGLYAKLYNLQRDKYTVKEVEQHE